VLVRKLDPKTILWAKFDTIPIEVDSQGLANLSGSRAVSKLFDVTWELGLERPDENCLTVARFASDDVDAPMNAVTLIHIQSTSGLEHGPVAPGLTLVRVARGIILGIGFDFDDLPLCELAFALDSRTTQTEVCTNEPRRNARSRSGKPRFRYNLAD
jgi:hypothetical protein